MMEENKDMTENAPETEEQQEYAEEKAGMEAEGAPESAEDVQDEPELSEKDDDKLTGDGAEVKTDDQEAGEQDTEAEGESASEEGSEKTEESGAGQEADSKDRGETDKSQEKKGFFSKRKEKKDKKDAQIEELTDRVRRQMAEFDNFRKRTEKEKAANYEIGAKGVIEKILPVVDNFERGLDAAKDKADDPFVQGMQMIYKQLMTTLEGMEVRPIEAVGQPFDPEFHNAVMHVDDENAGENIVVEEFQKGYLYRNSVVRHSMVKVAN